MDITIRFYRISVGSIPTEATLENFDSFTGYLKRKNKMNFIKKNHQIFYPTKMGNHSNYRS